MGGISPYTGPRCACGAPLGHGSKATACTPCAIRATPIDDPAAEAYRARMAGAAPDPASASAPAASAPKPYANLGELLAEAFDPFLDIIPGTRARRDRLVAIARETRRAVSSRGRKARLRVQAMKRITIEQVDALRHALENQT